jgi:hypothetical protein
VAGERPRLVRSTVLFARGRGRPRASAPTEEEEDDGGEGGEDEDDSDSDGSGFGDDAEEEEEEEGAFFPHRRFFGRYICFSSPPPRAPRLLTFYFAPHLRMKNAEEDSYDEEDVEIGIEDDDEEEDIEYEYEEGKLTSCSFHLSP